MSDTPTLPPFIQTQNLFQPYYLLQHVAPGVPLTPAETANYQHLHAARATANAACAKVATVWDERHAQLSVSEANVEDYVAEVCRILGMVPSSQGSIPREGTTYQRVDLVLFADDAAANRFAEHTKQRAPAHERYAEALAVVEVERIDKPFNPPGAKSDNPQQQIVNYLTFTGVPWGILTDGKRWRIYRRFDPPRFGAFLEINLAEILALPDPVAAQEAFWWFAGFFQRAAFDRHKRTARLDVFYDGSVQYAVGVQESLRDQAFKVVEELARGMYVTHTAPDTIDLTTLYDQAIVILYRLLFLKFAEDRQILPVQNASYRVDYGYTSVEDDLLTRLDHPTSSLGNSSASTKFWKRLMHLFYHINEGNPDADIFAYDGGLFRPDRLGNVAIPDGFLARACDHLARITRNQKKYRISYRDLEIRHLGSIYEGLLEQHLEQMDGTVHLVSTAGEPINERRSSGSYYTPDYIVDYIVQQTIDPLCEHQTADEIASLTILDPAMGSGHFLVTALTRLAQHHALARNQASIPPPQRLPTESDEAFAERMNAYEARIAATDEDVARSKCELVERCIYGVDLNPLAVELAKLALWLSTLARERPLSFLDHHLMTGNSLIGARLDDLESLNGNGAHANGSARQLGLCDQVLGRVRERLLESFQRIAALPTRTAQDMHEKEQEYARFRDFSEPLRMVANVWVSQHFGNHFNGDQYQEMLEALEAYYSDPADETRWHALQQQPWFVYAEEQARQKHFFHWELEFPEVFLREKRGFDVVIENPPYVDIKRLEKKFIDYLFGNYSTMRLRINLFVAFLEKSLNLANERCGYISLIIPTAFLTQVSYASLRAFIFQNYWLRKIVRLPNEIFGQVAGDVKVDTCIITVSVPTTSERNTEVLIYETFKRIEVLSRSTADRTIDVTQQKWESQKEMAIVLSSEDDAIILDRIRSVSISLEDLCEFCLGLTPYDKYAGHTQEQIKNKVFHANSPIDETYKKLLLSGDVRRYDVTWNGQKWIRYGKWLAAPREKRFFTRERILVQQIIDWSSLRLFAGLTDEELYNTQNQFNMLARKDTNLKFILAVFNARLNSYYHRKVFLDVALQRFQKVLIKDAKTFPIRRIHFTTPQAEREQRVRDLIAHASTMTAPGSPLKIVRDVAMFRASEFGQALATLLPMDEQGQFLAFKAGATGSEEHSDVVHDLLAHLAQRMIELNRQRREHLTDLLTDLEGVMNASDWNKLGKTRQLWNPRTKKAEATSDATTILGSLNGEPLTIDDDIGRISRDQFRWLLKHKLGPVQRLSDVLKTYDQYHMQIATIEHQRTATDMLIDQVVYMLYGLTTDEIALMEST